MVIMYSILMKYGPIQQIITQPRQISQQEVIWSIRPLLTLTRLSLSLPGLLLLSQAPLLLLFPKQSIMASISSPGTLNYTITVTNAGTVGLSGVTVSDAFAGGATYVSGDSDNDNILDLTEAWIFTADYVATQADIDLGANLVNIVSVTSTEVTTPVTAQAVTTITIQHHELTLVKTAAENIYDAVGDVIHYTIVVTNTGNVTLTNIIVFDQLTNYRQLISSLNPGASQTITTNYTVNQNDINVGEVLNRAIATYTYAGQQYFVDDEVTVPGSQGPDLTITKNAAESSYSAVNSLIHYTVVVTNTGNVTLTNVVVTDPLTLLNNTIGILAPGESITFNPTYSIVQNDINRGYLNNTATAAFSYRGTPYTRIASVSIPADIGPGIDITKMVLESGYSSAGNILHYTIVVTNTGNVTLTDVEVTDPLTSITRTIPSLAPGATNTITATYTVTQNDLNAGQVNNTARAVAIFSGTMYSDEASATVPANQNPELEIIKAAGETSFTSIGETIHYTLVVTNTGNVTITGVIVNDPNTIVTCPGSPYILAPGDGVTCTAIHVVTIDDIAAGIIRNIAFVSGYGPNSINITRPSNEVIVPLNNLAPTITCPPVIVTGTSATTCNILINTGLNASFSDPNNNVESLTWVMTGATEAASPANGINQIGSYTFNLGITTITYTVTDGFGLSASCDFTVTVIDNIPPVAICANIDVYLDPNTGVVTIDESDINNHSTDNCGIASISIDRNEFTCINIGDNDVTLTVIDNSGNSGTCTAVVTVHYSVVPAPAVTPARDVICNDETTSLVLSSNIPGTTWTWTATPSTGISGASGDFTGLLTSIDQTLHNSDLVDHSVIYTITPTLYGQCKLNNITAEVLVNPTPQILVNPPENTICYGESSVITVSNPNTSVLGQWQYDLSVTADPGISGNTASGTYTSPTNLTETLINDGTEIQKVTYQFTPRIVQGDGGSDCVGPEQTVMIWVRPRIRYEKAVSDYNGYNVSCYGKSNGFIKINPSDKLAHYTYRWSGPNGFDPETKDISGLIAGQYTLSITDVNNCTTSETFVLNQPKKLSMTVRPSVSTDGLYNINCAGANTGSIAVGARNNVGQVDYLWIDGAIGSTRTNLSSGNYKVIITDSNNCQADSSLTLTEPEEIKLSFEVKDTYCPDSPDGSVIVNATGGVNGVDYTFIWSNNSNQKEIKDVKPGRYSVIVTDKNLCSVKDSARVKNQHEICLIIPDAFSPNGDLINDTWIIGNIEFYPQAEITIYNRWGQLIWQSERGYYGHPWDGRSKGIPMPIDGYHYVIDLHNGYKVIVGDVTLVR